MEPAPLTAYAPPADGDDAPIADDRRLAPEHLRAHGDVTDPATQPAPPPPPTPPGGALAPATVAEPPTGGSRTKAGFSLLGAVVSGAAGYWLGGGYGAGAGVLYFGALRNAVRTAGTVGKDGAEAAKAGTVTLLGLAAAGYLTYQAVQTRRQE